MLTTLTLASLLATAQPPERNSNALTVLAEVALERGDCKTASESYAAAVPNSSVDIAKRASELLERFVDNGRVTVLLRRGRREDIQPSGSDDSDAKRQVARVDQVNAHCESVVGSPASRTREFVV